MRKKRCNHCKLFSPVYDWDYGCPNCGYDNATGEFVQISEFPGVEVMPDIKPYRNMMDGKEIGSRSTHRKFLHRHGLTEIGNETKYLKPQSNAGADLGRKELIIAQVQAFGGETKLRQAVKREVEYRRWNSRKD